MASTLTGCLKYEKKANSSTTGTMTMVCDETFRNIIEQEIDVFEYQYPDAHVLAMYATQNEALDSLFSLNTRTVVIARDLTKKNATFSRVSGATSNARKSPLTQSLSLSTRTTPATY